MAGWFGVCLLAVTSATVLLQLFVLFLVLAKCPKEMHSFRFALFLFTSVDLCFSATLGFGLAPDPLVPLARGAFVEGLARSLGPDCGRIGFGAAILCGAGMLAAQVYALMFRWSAIQQRFVDLHDRFNRWSTRIFFLILGFSIASICGVAGYFSVAGPEEVVPVLRSRHHFAEMMAILGPNSVLILFNMDTTPGRILPSLIGGGFALAQLLSLAMSMAIFRTLRANAHRFSARTYQLHVQLTILLIIQFCLPILCVILPVVAGIAAILLDWEVDKCICQLALLMIAIYASANSLLTVLFVAPFREYSAKLLAKAMPFCTVLKNVGASRVIVLETTANPSGANNLPNGGNIQIAMNNVQNGIQ